MIDQKKTLHALKEYLSAMTEEEKRVFLEENNFVYQDEKEKERKLKQKRAAIQRAAPRKRRSTGTVAHTKKKSVKPAI